MVQFNGSYLKIKIGNALKGIPIISDVSFKKKRSIKHYCVELSSEYLVVKLSVDVFNSLQLEEIENLVLFNFHFT